MKNVDGRNAQGGIDAARMARSGAGAKFLGGLVFCSVFFLLPCLSARAQSRGRLQAVSADFNELSFVEFASNAQSALPKAQVVNSFTIGEDSQTYTARRYVEPFKINAFETTYNLWYIVRTFAEQNGYVFANPGQEGSYGKRGAPPTTEGAMQPVTMVNWYDVVVWCNAFSQMEGRRACYTYNGKILRDATDTTSLDKCVCNWKANGYRLPSETEWEFAARFKNRSEPPYFQSGALASGQDDGVLPEDIAWFDANANSTHIVGTAGTVFSDAPRAGSGNANFMKLYDMSGNVLEFCWDWYDDYKEQRGRTRYAGPEIGDRRICRGGSWSPYTGFIYAGDRYAYDPNEAYNFLGFRICSSAN